MNRGARNISGKISERPLVEVIGGIYAQSLTGQFIVRVRKAEYKIFFFKGMPTYATSSLASDNIFETMVSMGKLDRDDVPRLEKLVEQGNAPEEALYELGVISSTDLYGLKQLLVREIITRACGYKEGTYEFIEGEEIFEDLPMYDISPITVLYEAINRYMLSSLPEKIQQMSQKQVRLNPRAQSLESVPEIFYQRTYLLDDFHQEMSVEEAISLLNREFKDLNQALIFFYVMYGTGILSLEIPKAAALEAEAGNEPVEVEAEPASESPAAQIREEQPRMEYIYVTGKKAKKFKVKAPEPQALQEKPRSESPRPANEELKKAPEPLEPEKPVQPREAALSSEEKFSPELDSERKLILLETKFHSSNDYPQMLDVKVSAAVPEIERAYFKIIRQYQLEEIIKAQDPALTPRASELKEKAKAAVAVLSNPDQRNEYEKNLYKNEFRRAYTLPLKRELAKKQFERGKWYLDQHRPEPALERFEQAMELDPEQADHFAYTGWAMYRAGKGSIAQAEGYLKQALRLSSRSDMACYFLGAIAKREGREDQAEEYFKRALSINPENKSAAREIDSIEKHKKESGILQRLFARKK